MHRDRGIPLQGDNLVAQRQLHILPAHSHNPANGSTVGRLGKLGGQHAQRHRQHQFIALGGAHGGSGLQHHRLSHVVAGFAGAELIPRCGHSHEAVAREGIRVGVSGRESAMGISLHRGKPERAGIKIAAQTGRGGVWQLFFHFLITTAADEHALVAEVAAAQVLAHQLSKAGEGAHAVLASVHAVETAERVRQVIPHHLQGAFILRKEGHLSIRHRFSGGIGNHATHLAGLARQQGLLRCLELHHQFLFCGLHPHQAGSHLEQGLAIGPAGPGILHQAHAHIHTRCIRCLQRHLNHRVGHRHLAAQVAQHLAALHRHQQLGIHRGLHQHAGCLARLVRILFGQQHQPGISHVFPGGDIITPHVVARGAVELASPGIAAAQLHIVATCPIHRDFQLLRGAGQLHGNPALCVFICRVADSRFEDRAVAVRAEHRALHRELCRQRLAIPRGAIRPDRHQFHRQGAAGRGQQ